MTVSISDTHLHSSGTFSSDFSVLTWALRNDVCVCVCVRVCVCVCVTLLILSCPLWLGLGLMLCSGEVWQRRKALKGLMFKRVWLNINTQQSHFTTDNFQHTHNSISYQSNQFPNISSVIIRMKYHSGSTWGGRLWVLVLHLFLRLVKISGRSVWTSINTRVSCELCSNIDSKASRVSFDSVTAAPLSAARLRTLHLCESSSCVLAVWGLLNAVMRLCDLCFVSLHLFLCVIHWEIFSPSGW